MGGKKKDKKEKREARKERAEAKAEKKKQKTIQKQNRKRVDDLGEDDIEVLLAQFKKREAEKVSINVDDTCDVPSARLHCTLVPNPSKDHELIMFGGEYWNGQDTLSYADLYVYNYEKNTWKLVISPNTPPPRSSHQAVCYKHYMYLFGGEFTSPSQNQYYHYNDVWRLDTQTWKWEQLKLKGGPQARSGHRMVLWKRSLVLFGGFYDTLSSKDTKYFDDVWLLTELDGAPKWKKVEYKPGAAVPPPRSGCTMGLHGDTFFIYGGFSSERQGDWGSMKPVVHSDGWTFGLNGQVWNKVKKTGIAPSQRSGAAMAVDRQRCIFFGGVWDFDTKEDLNSTFFGDMYVFNMANKRWFPLHLHVKKAKNKESRKEKRKQAKQAKLQQQKEKAAGEGDTKEKEGEEEQTEEPEEDEEEKPMKQKSNTMCMVDEDEQDDDEDDEIPGSPTTTASSVGEISESSSSVVPAAETTTTTTAAEPEPAPIAPCPRINSQMCVIGNYLYLYGGMHEEGKKEVTMNDMYRLNLHKLETWEPMFDHTKYDWVEEPEEEDEESEEEEGGKKKPGEDDGEEEDEEEELEEEDEEDEEEEEDEDGEKKEKKKKKNKDSTVVKAPRRKRTLREALLESLAESAEGVPTPEIFEPLREFFKRTQEFWLTEAMEITKEVGKTLRKDGFHLCQRRFQDVRPILGKLEEIETARKEEEAAQKAFAEKKEAEAAAVKKRKQAQEAKMKRKGERKTAED